MGVISRHWTKLSIAQRRADPKTYAARTYFSGGHNSKQNRPVPACHTRCRISAQIAGLGSFKDPIIFRDAQMGSWDRCSVGELGRDAQMGSWGNMLASAASIFNSPLDHRIPQSISRTTNVQDCREKCPCEKAFEERNSQQNQLRSQTLVQEQGYGHRSR